MSFADDIRRFQVVVETRLNDVFLGCVQDAHESIVVGSPLTGSPGQPVDTGYLRNSWQVGIGDNPQFIAKGDGSDNAGTKESPLPPAGVNAQASVAIINGATKAVIATNVEYAPQIEAGIRSLLGKRGDAGVSSAGSKQRLTTRSKTGGAKSVASTVANWDKIVAKNVREVTGGNP